MKFQETFWLLGTLLGIVVAVGLALGGVSSVRAIARFGYPDQIKRLLTAVSAGRRATKGVLLVLGIVAAFVALAGPQYGRGTRLIPATNLDVVVVLDYSKSMYARDVAPSRIDRAKTEVAELIRQLAGARFGAVAFAGQPLSFPLTSDGGAIAQFFRQLTPNDMPVGGTAIARALDSARGLFQRDPLSKNHRRVILLVTDGEDLEGDPVNVARAANSENIAVHVVQIGGRAPEPLPDISEDGKVKGFRRDAQGRPLTTELSTAGEKQLTEIASAGHGTVVRSEAGQTGIDEMKRSLKAMMSKELSERVETVYADVYAYPLGLAILLLLLEVVIGQVPRRRAIAKVAAPGLVSLAVGLLGLGCDKVAEVEERVFIRNSPAVDGAIGAFTKGDLEAAGQGLAKYLKTGDCKEGNLAVTELVRERPSASFDFGLVLFQVGEKFGERFGVPVQSGNPEQEANLGRRSQEVDCALLLVRVIAQAESVPLELRAEAFYLAGNLEFLRQDYKAAVKNYDDSLELWPGGLTNYGLTADSATAPANQAGDALGDRAAWNRSIALGRIKDEPEKPPEDDSPEDDSKDEQDDKDKEQDKEEQKDKDDQKKDQDEQDDKDKDSPPKPDPNEQDKEPSDQPKPGDEKQPQSDSPSADQDKREPSENQAGKQEQPSLSNDDRILDLLEQAPTLQQEAARRQRAERAGEGHHTEDK